MILAKLLGMGLFFGNENINNKKKIKGKRKKKKKNEFGFRI